MFSELPPELEWLAAALGVIYVFLAAREIRWCWVTGFVSTGIYTALFYTGSLPMQSMLNAYYMLMAVYGWWKWSQTKQSHSQASSEQAMPEMELKIARLGWMKLIVVLAGIALATAISVHFLKSQFNSEWLWLDAAVTWGSVTATWLMAHKCFENWMMWIFFDVLGIVLFYNTGYYATVGLFSVYICTSIYGLLEWRKRLNDEQLQLSNGEGNE